jgi:hypothetical protein
MNGAWRLSAASLPRRPSTVLSSSGATNVQFGEGDREIDIWFGPGAKPIRRAYSRRSCTPDVYRAMVIEIAELNPIIPTKVK